MKMKSFLLSGLLAAFTLAATPAFAQSDATPTSGQSPNNDSTSIGSSGGVIGAPVPVPVNCTATTATWAVAGNTCSGSLPATNNGQYSQAVSTADGFIGAASYVCTSGTYYASGTPTCVVNNGSGANGQVQTYDITENATAAATLKVPYTASTVQITLHNTAAPVWGGDVNNFTEAWPFITYNHIVTVTSATGTVLSQQTFAPLGRTPMIREDNKGTSQTTWFGGTGWYDNKRGYSFQYMTGGNGDNSTLWGGNSNVYATHFPQLDSSATGSLKLTNVPAGAVITIYTAMTFENFTPSGNVTNITSTSQPGSFSVPVDGNGVPIQNVAAQSGSGHNGAADCGDERYCADFAIQNVSSWSKDYTLVVTAAGGPGATVSSCPAFTINYTSIQGQPCPPLSFPVENVGTVDEGYCSDKNSSGNTIDTRSIYTTCQADGTQSPIVYDDSP